MNIQREIQRTVVHVPCGPTCKDAIGWFKKLHKKTVAKNEKNLAAVRIEWAPAHSGYAIAWDFYKDQA